MGNAQKSIQKIEVSSYLRKVAYTAMAIGTLSMPLRITAQEKCDPVVDQHPPIINSLERPDGSAYSLKLDQISAQDKNALPMLQQINFPNIGFQCNGERYVAIKDLPTAASDASQGILKDLSIYKIDSNTTPIQVGAYKVESATKLEKGEAHALLTPEGEAKIHDAINVRHLPPPHSCKMYPTTLCKAR